MKWKYYTREQKIVDIIASILYLAYVIFLFWFLTCESIDNFIVDSKDYLSIPFLMGWVFISIIYFKIIGSVFKIETKEETKFKKEIKKAREGNRKYRRSNDIEIKKLEFKLKQLKNKK